MCECVCVCVCVCALSCMQASCLLCVCVRVCSLVCGVCVCALVYASVPTLRGSTQYRPPRGGRASGRRGGRRRAGASRNPPETKTNTRGSLLSLTDTCLCVCVCVCVCVEGGRRRAGVWSNPPATKPATMPVHTQEPACTPTHSLTFNHATRVCVCVCI